MKFSFWHSEKPNQNHVYLHFDTIVCLDLMLLTSRTLHSLRMSIVSSLENSQIITNSLIRMIDDNWRGEKCQVSLYYYVQSSMRNALKHKRVILLTLLLTISKTICNSYFFFSLFISYFLMIIFFFVPYSTFQSKEVNLNWNKDGNYFGYFSVWNFQNNTSVAAAATVVSFSFVMLCMQF